jgi:hypothetical protein
MMQWISFYQLELTNQTYNLNYRVNIFNNHAGEAEVFLKRNHVCQ